MELTREIVLAEPPGKRLDSWIAEKVMGWSWGIIGDLIPAYSTDIAAAWEVVEKMFEYGGCEIGCYGSKSGGKWFEVVVITTNGEVKVTAHTAHEAICKAALLAVLEE